MQKFTMCASEILWLVSQGNRFSVSMKLGLKIEGTRADYPLSGLFIRLTDIA